MLFFTLQNFQKKQFKYLSLVKNFEKGYWILSDSISMLEGGNRKILEYFIEKSGLSFLGSRMPLTFVNIQGPEFDFEAR